MGRNGKSGRKWNGFRQGGAKWRNIAYICNVRKANRHILVVLLALSVLLGSLGVALSETICRMTGSSASAATTSKACCTAPTNSSDQDNCCEKSVSYEKLEPVAVQKQYNLLAPVFFFSASKPLLPLGIAGASAEARLYSYTDSSPPLHGRDLLHRYHVLIV